MLITGQLVPTCLCDAMQGPNSEVDYKRAAEEILPKNEVQIYTWPDATVREICDLLKGVVNFFLIL